LVWYETATAKGPIMAYETLFCETENTYSAPAFHAGDAE
jgi:hypothetical protein